MLNFLLLFIIILLNLFLLTKSSSFEFSPSWVAFGFWTLQSLIIRLVFFSYKWNGLGLVFIQLCVLFFCFSYEYSRNFIVTKPTKNPVIPNMFMMNALGLISCILGCYSALYFSFQNGINFADFLSFEGLLKINNRLAVLRYTGKSNYDLFHSILQIFVAFTPMIFGYIYGLSERKWTIPFSFLPALLAVLLENTKAPFIASLVLWFGCFLMGYYCHYLKFPIITKKTILRLMIFFVLVVILLLFSMMLRIGKIDQSTLQVVLKKFMNYAFGHIIAFDHWFGLYLSSGYTHSLTWGRYSLFSIFDSLNIVSRPQGVYLDYVTVNQISTNVYTLFRGVIEDFGIFGALFSFVLLGFVAGFSVKHVNSSAYLSPVYQLSISFIYIYLLFYMVSILTYTTYLCAFILFLVLLFSFRRKNIEVE